ncbi:MAG TPA: hypothetical protein VMT18_09260 [Planctomycetota bacterium]|nr:hypothetical protein [Planctomycetota bacterium]
MSRSPTLAPVALLAWALAAAPLSAAPQGPDDARLRQAWGYLNEEEQDDVASWFRAEVEHLGTFQNTLLAAALALDPRDPGLFPEAPPIAWFDPEVHAPKQPIVRRVLDAGDARVASTRASFRAAAPAPDVPSAWRYDWGLRQVVRSGDFQSAQHVFDGALAGFAPRVDLAQALIECALDDGAQQGVMAAFGHAYTDRAGWVYPGLTLWDAWSSGTEFEMPDVDVLGLVATISGKKPRWKAPVPESQHDELYATVGEWFAEARAARALREACARTYFVGSAALPAAWTPHVLRLHGLWEEHQSDAPALATELSKARDPADVLPKWAKRFDKDSKRNEKARTRLATLDWDRRQVRGLLVRILEEYGAMERTSKPKPKPEAPAGG